jgi:hypothetical protein
VFVSDKSDRNGGGGWREKGGEASVQMRRLRRGGGTFTEVRRGDGVSVQRPNAEVETELVSSG